MDTENILDVFGKEFIERVRDLSIEKYHMIREGKMKSAPAKKIHALISSFNNEEKNKIDEIVYDAIEEVVFNCLFMFESSDNFSIAPKEETDPAHDLGQISDGLAGELFSDEGWIKKYSQFPSQE